MAETGTPPAPGSAGSPAPTPATGTPPAEGGAGAGDGDEGEGGAGAGTPAPGGGGGAAAGAGAGAGGGKKRVPIPTIRIPQQAFMTRVQEEMARQIKRQTGVSLEEAIKIVKANKVGAPAAASAPAGGNQPAATGGGGQGPSRTEQQLKKQVDTLAKTNETLNNKLNKQRQNNDKIRRNAQNRLAEAEIRQLALGAGVKEGDVDFALNLFAQEVGKNADAAKDPRTFFGALKPARPYLFVDGPAPVPPPAPVPVRPTTAGPGSAQPGGGAPVPVTQAAPAQQKTVDEMTDREFKHYRRNRHQF